MSAIAAKKEAISRTQKSLVRSVQTCLDCSGKMEGHIENYRYLESGLKNVVICGILVFHCGQCGAVVPEISGASNLNSLIGIRLLFKEGRLNGEELRFLRKLVGYSATDLAQLAGTSKSVVSRWEHKSTFGENTDRLIRLICFNKMLRDAIPNCDNPAELGGTRTLFEPTQFAQFMESALKRLRAKDSKKIIEIEQCDLENINALPVPPAETVKGTHYVS